jgi:hypothetical protein
MPLDSDAENKRPAEPEPDLGAVDAVFAQVGREPAAPAPSSGQDRPQLSASLPGDAAAERARARAYGRTANNDEGFVLCTVRYVLAYNSFFLSVVVGFAVAERAFGPFGEQAMPQRFGVVAGGGIAALGIFGLLYLGLKQVGLWPANQPGGWDGIAVYLALLSAVPFLFCVGLPLLHWIAWD